MKVLGALIAILVALLGGIAIILNAPPYIGSNVPAVVGIAFAASLAVILRGPLGRALVGQLHGGEHGPDLQDRISAQLDELLDEFRILRQENTELQERVDFTERLLAQHRNALSPGESGRDDRV